MKPATKQEMLNYISRIGVEEGMNLHALIKENGWAATEEEAGEYLKSLDIYPWDD